MAAGAIRDIDAPVLSYFPEYKDLQTPNVCAFACATCCR